jgi:hypothetical protein
MLSPPATATATSRPSSLAVAAQAGSGQVACDYNDARASAQRVFQFLDRMVDDPEGS